jgi:hypothetical protein
VDAQANPMKLKLISTNVFLNNKNKKIKKVQLIYLFIKNFIGGTVWECGANRVSQKFNFFC